MNFDDFIKKLPELKRAKSESDSKRILAFMEKNTSSQNRFTLFYDRSPDFFSLLRLSGPSFFVIYYENANHEIEGVISYTLLKGQDEDSLYVSDLKVKTKSEDMKTKWRQFADDFIENLKSIDEFQKVRYIHMVMMDDNTRAYQRLVASKMTNFDYEKVFGYKMVNILGDKRWKKKASSAFHYSLTAADADSLKNLMTEFSSSRRLANHPELINHRAREMASLTKIIEVKDSSGLILMRAALEDVSTAKRIIIKRLPLRLKLLTRVLSVFGGKTYEEGRPLDIVYMSLISFHPSVTDRSTLLTYAVEKTFKAFAGKYHMLSLSFFDNENDLVEVLKEKFLTQIEPLGFYQIRPSWGEKLPSRTLPYFDLCYI